VKAGSPTDQAKAKDVVANALVPVSWEHALDLVAGELDRVKRDHGHDAIMSDSQG
jgi:biotin/methionine sulfoxide reductase